MRRWLLARFCCLLMTPAALAEDLPDEPGWAECMTLLRAWYTVDAVEDFAELADVDGAPMRFILFRSEGTRCLGIYYPDPTGAWRTWNTFSAAIPQMTEAALHDACTATNPRTPSYEDVKAIYERLW